MIRANTIYRFNLAVALVRSVTAETVIWNERISHQWRGGRTSERIRRTPRWYFEKYAEAA